MELTFLLEHSKTRCTERYVKIHYPEEYQEIMKIEGKKFTEKLYKYFHKESHVCPMCGKPAPFQNMVKGYSKYCSLKCSSNDPLRTELIKETKFELYGDGNYNNREKFKQTMKDKPIGFQDRERTKKWCIEKYGVENVSYVKEIREKAEQTCLERFGVKSTLSLEENQKKSQQKCIEKYGVPRTFMVPEFNIKARKARRDKFIGQHKDLIDIKDEIWICKCPHPGCNKCEEKTYETNQHIYNDRRRINAELCTKLVKIGHLNQNTTVECFVKNILDEYNIQYEINNRSILNGKEIDIYIPSLKIGIECNGVYWHSDKSKSKKYHVEKFSQCMGQNIQLIFIWEDWIINKPEIVKSLLKSKLGICNNTIYARKCVLKEVKPKEANKFLEENHIQGKCNSSIKIGLYNDSKLVSLMCFDKKHQLVRFCNLKDHRVVGGASKLLKYYIKTYKPNTIISYSSNDISNGHLYKKLGFKPSNTIQTAYWYISPDMKRYHRATFSRQGINRKWPEYKLEDHSWTEKSVMDSKGYNRIYDSGTVKWVLKREDF